MKSSLLYIRKKEVIELCIWNRASEMLVTDMALWARDAEGLDSCSGGRLERKAGFEKG